MPSIVKLTLESNQYEKGMRQAQKQWNEFTKGLGLSMNKFSAVGAAVGAVTGALKLAKDAFRANELMLDEWGRTVEASKSIYNGFLNALNTGDISGFLSNIDQIVSAAKNAYNALDELQTFQAFNQVQDARSRANYAKALDAYKTNPTAENKAALEAANKAVVENIKAEQSYTAQAYSEALNRLATERGLTGGTRGQFIDMFKNNSYSQLVAIRDLYKEGKAGRQLYNGNRVLGSKIQDSNTGVWREMEEGEKKKFEFARVLNQVNDDQIKAAQALGKQAEMLEEAIWNQNRSYNRMSGNNASKGGGSKGGGLKNVKVEQTELQKNQAQINTLTQEYVTLGDVATQQAIARKEAIQGEIHALTQRNNQLKLYAEQAQGKLQGGHVMMSNLGGGSQWNPEFADKPFLEIGEGLSDDVMAKVNLLAKSGNNAADAWTHASTAIGLFGSAISAIKDPAAQVAATVAQAIATVAMAYAQSLAKDKGTQSNIWAFIAAAAAATISMVTTIASIHSATGYSHGGVVDGNSYSGDNVPIMANAGEVVLTKAMQANLANQLDGAGLQGLGPSSVSGEQIYVVLNRYTRRSGKGELVTW